MKLFDVVPNDLFSVLASPNRILYSDALDVLYSAYRENLKIPENTLYIMLRSRLEQQLTDACFDGEDIDEEELKDISVVVTHSDIVDMWYAKPTSENE